MPADKLARFSLTAAEGALHPHQVRDCAFTVALDQPLDYIVVVSDDQVAVRNSAGNKTSCVRENPAIDQAFEDQEQVQAETLRILTRLDRVHDTAMEDFATIFDDDGRALFTQIAAKLDDDVIPVVKTAADEALAELRHVTSQYENLELREWNSTLEQNDVNQQRVEDLMSSLRQMQTAAAGEDSASYDLARQRHSSADFWLNVSSE